MCGRRERKWQAELYLFSPVETKQTFTHYYLTGGVSYMAMLKSLSIVVAVI